MLKIGIKIFLLFTLIGVFLYFAITSMTKPGAAGEKGSVTLPPAAGDTTTKSDSITFGNLLIIRSRKTPTSFYKLFVKDSLNRYRPVFLIDTSRAVGANYFYDTSVLSKAMYLITPANNNRPVDSVTVTRVYLDDMRFDTLYKSIPADSISVQTKRNILVRKGGKKKIYPVMP